MKSVFLSLLMFFNMDFRAIDKRNTYCLVANNNNNYLICCLAEHVDQCLYKNGKDTPTKFQINRTKNPDFIFTPIELTQRI